jgi:hypothetical protein
MKPQHMLGGAQTLLVVGALVFAAAGFVAPQQQRAPQAACAADTAGGPDNPRPPCNCEYDSDCPLPPGCSISYCDNSQSFCIGSEPGAPCGSACTGDCVAFC